MCVGSPTAWAWSSFQRRPDDGFETDRYANRIFFVSRSVAFHVWKKALGCTTFQPHWKAFFNPKAPLLAQKNDALRLGLCVSVMFVDAAVVLPRDQLSMPGTMPVSMRFSLFATLRTSKALLHEDPQLGRGVRSSWAVRS